MADPAVDVSGDGRAARVALTIAQRRGKRIAVVALARRRAGVRYALWRDGVPYDAQQLRPQAKTEYKRAG